MSVYLLDTNVISEWWKPKPATAVLAWTQKAEWLVPVPVLAELWEGVAKDPSPARRVSLVSRLERIEQDFAAAMIPWDAATARIWGQLQHSEEVKRKPQSLWDSLIDALAVAGGFTVATRNVGDFRHASTFDPWTFSE